jgi:hypothetical protein
VGRLRGQCHTLVVEEVFANGYAWVIYGYGASAALNIRLPGFLRTTGRIVDGILLCVGAYSTGQGFACQMSAAYSAMVRSLENLPEWPTLRIALRAQASGCLYRALTCAWVWT